MRQVPDALPATIDVLLGLANTTPQPNRPDPITILPLLGVSVGVTLRLKPVRGTILHEQKTALTSLYTTLVPPSRTLQ